MIFNFFRISFLFLLVLFQYSFLNAVFLKNLIPNIVMIFVVLYVAILGFDRSWKWIVILGIFVDLFTFSIIGKNVIIFVILAYLVSLVSQRILFGRHEKRPFVVFFLVFVVTVFYNIFEIVWMNDSVVLSNISWIASHSGFFSKSIFVQTIFGFIFFHFMHKMISRFEESVSFYDRKVLN